MVEQLLGMGGDVPKNIGVAEVKGYDGKYWAGTDGHIYAYGNSRVTSRKPKPFRLSESFGSMLTASA